MDWCTTTPTNSPARIHVIQILHCTVQQHDTWATYKPFHFFLVSKFNRTIVPSLCNNQLLLGVTTQLTIAPSLCNRYLADSYFHNSWFLVHYHKTFKSRKVVQGIPIKCFVSHRPPSCEGGSVGQRRSGKKKTEHMKGPFGCQWRPVNKTRSSGCKLKYLLLYKWLEYFSLLQKKFCGNCLLTPNPSPTPQIRRPFPTVVLYRALVITLSIHMGYWDGSILPPWVANHIARFGSSCPFLELAI